MIGPAVTLITYIWHYALARLIYDQLLRPAIQGRISAILLICAVSGAAFLVWRRWRRRRLKWVTAPRPRRRA